MRASGGRIFWASFFSLWRSSGRFWGCSSSGGVQQNRRAVQTQQAQSGVPIQRPGSLSLLLAVADERPAFVLVRLDGAAPAFRLIVVPGESVVLDGQGQPITLAESYAAAGPAGRAVCWRPRWAFSWTAIWPPPRPCGAEPFRPGAGAGQPLSPAGRSRAPGFGGGRRGSAGRRRSRLPLTEDALSPARRWGRLRTAVWQAFALQCQGSLAESVPQGLRRCSGDLLTDLTALDLEELGRVLAQLADASLQPPGRPSARPLGRAHRPL